MDTYIGLIMSFKIKNGIHTTFSSGEKKEKLIDMSE
jgi:hypothetical protein